MGSTDTNREEALMAVVSTPRTCWLLEKSKTSPTRTSLEGTLEDDFMMNLLEKAIDLIDYASFEVDSLSPGISGFVVDSSRGERF
jgi:hypothetical protein